MRRLWSLFENYNDGEKGDILNVIIKSVERDLSGWKFWRYLEKMIGRQLQRVAALLVSNFVYT